ncbi:MAG: hypothetical protein AAF640_00365 [Pseudomonadota bacterium]
MSRRLISFVFLPPFLALTVWALLNGGIMGILNTYQTPGGAQVFADLVISLILLLTFLVPHARAHGRNPWIWVGLTLGLGSIAPLLYFATGSQRETAEVGVERSAT